MAADRRSRCSAGGDCVPRHPRRPGVVPPLDTAVREGRHRLRELRGGLFRPAQHGAEPQAFLRRAACAREVPRRVGFDVMSCANNHMIDAAPRSRDTLDVLRLAGDPDDRGGRRHRRGNGSGDPRARRASGRLPRLLAASTVGYEARADRPGWPAAGAHLLRRSDPTSGSPGSIRSTPRCVPETSSASAKRSAAARRDADFVVVPRTGATRVDGGAAGYELELARDAVVTAADAVMCCHHHSLRGIEIHRASRSSTASDADPPLHLDQDQRGRPRCAEARSAGAHRSPRTRSSRLSRSRRRTKTGIAVLELAADGTIETGFIPAHMGRTASTEPLRADDPRAAGRRLRGAAECPERSRRASRAPRARLDALKVAAAGTATRLNGVAPRPRSTPHSCAVSTTRRSLSTCCSS